MQKLTFLMFCCSRPGGVAKHKNSVPALGAVHFFFCLAPSLRFAFLVFATPLVRECVFLHMPDADVLLARRFFTSSMHSELIEHVSSNSIGKFEILDSSLIVSEDLLNVLSESLSIATDGMLDIINVSRIR